MSYQLSDPKSDQEQDVRVIDWPTVPSPGIGQHQPNWRAHPRNRNGNRLAGLTPPEWAALNACEVEDVEETEYDLLYESNLRRSKVKHRAKKYGLTLEQFERLAAAQRHRCAVCGRHETETGTLHIDHDHDTGLVRGLLCSQCNTALGMLREDRTILSRAIGYLAHPPARKVLDLPGEGSDQHLQVVLVDGDETPPRAGP